MRQTRQYLSVLGQYQAHLGNFTIRILIILFQGNVNMYFRITVSLICHARAVVECFEYKAVFSIFDPLKQPIFRIRRLRVKSSLSPLH